MKRFLSYVGILFVIQIIVLFAVTQLDPASGVRNTFLFPYHVPAGFIWGTLMDFGLDDLEHQVTGLLLFLFLGLVVLAYSLLIAAFLSAITFVIRLIRAKTITK